VFTWASSWSTPTLCAYLCQLLVQHQSPRKHLEDAATIFLQTSFLTPSTNECIEQKTEQIQRPLIKHYRNITAVISTQCFDSCWATGRASRLQPTCAMKHKDLLLGDPVLPHHHHTTTVLRPFFRDHPGELVPEENFWTLWCKERLTEAYTPIWLGATPSGLTSVHLQQPPTFLQARRPSYRQTNSVKALTAPSLTQSNLGKTRLVKQKQKVVVAAVVLNRRDVTGLACHLLLCLFSVVSFQLVPTGPPQLNQYQTSIMNTCVRLQTTSISRLLSNWPFSAQ